MELKRLCKQRGLTITSLARSCGLARPTLSRIANGQMTTERTFLLICGKLGVKPEELTGIQYTVIEVRGREVMQKENQ